MQGRFSDHSYSTLNLAIKTASDLGHIYVGTEHLLYALVEADGFPAELNKKDILKRIEQLSDKGEKTFLSPEDMTPALKKVLARGAESTPAGEEVDNTALFIALLESDCVATRLLDDMDIDTDNLKKALERKKHTKMSAKREVRLSTPNLDRYSVSLTEKAEAGEIDPVVGREKEEERILRILLRRRKNNPLLIGEAGVGKTAVAESIALRISKGKVPEEMLNRRILSLDMACLVAGTKYRGEFEEKLRNIIREATEDKDVILFIDEIHTLVGAGAAEGAVDASNILKPALARGEVQLIGATTPKEFKKSIEKDGALCRRFQQVYVNEPTVEECKTVLYALKDKYEKYHGVCISHQAITAAAEYSHRFISGRYLPDKAIDLIDEASSAKRMSGGETVTERDIAYLTEEMSGVPLEFITDSDYLRVDQAENTLKNGIIGQDAAVSAIIAAVKRRSSRIAEEGHPAGSMLFYGPCGVGKTECAKKLAFALSGSPKGLISIDMSEYTEPHSVSRLIGAPPGYTGSGEGGVLTEAVRRTPFSTVLFDNAEKAHPDVKNLISRILDKGALTDSDGLTVSFADATVIITVSDESLSARAGFYSGKEGKDITALLPSDITERVDDIIFFAPLDTCSLERIGFDHAEKLSLLARRRGEDIFLPSDAVKNAVKECKGSARTLCRDITRLTQEKMWEKQSEKVREYQKST